MELNQEISKIAEMIGDKTRASILIALLEGRALTAGELAIRANVSPQTASNHLAKLLRMNFLRCETYARHRYYYIASPLVAHALEALSLLTPEVKRPPGHDKLNKDICFARSCYDHIAGTVGVKIADALVSKNFLNKVVDTFAVTEKGKDFFCKLNIDCDVLIKQKRNFAKHCLDWTERKHHLAGSLGAALLNSLLEQRYMIRANKSRVLYLTEKGKKELATLLSIQF